MRRCWTTCSSAKPDRGDRHRHRHRPCQRRFLESASDHEPVVVGFDFGRMLISGADGQDDVIGSPGNDILDGLAGDDRYLGGDGSDVFVLGAGDLDQVFDVMAGADLIDVSAWGTESLDGLTITGGAGTVLLVDETTGDMAVVRDPAGTLVPEDLTEASFVFAPADMSLAGVDESLLSTGIA